MSPFLSPASGGRRAIALAALLAGCLALPAAAQNPGPGTYNIGLAGTLSDTDTTLNPGLVTLANGTSLNLNGIAVAGGLTGLHRGLFNGYNVLGAGDPQLENLPDARAAFNPLGNIGIYAPPAPSGVVEFFRDGAPAAVNYPNANDPNPPFPALPGNFFNNIFSRWSGELNVTTAGNYTFGARSDDGSIVYVDGVLVVNNNRFQGSTTRTNQFLPASTPQQPSASPINLTAGAHRIEMFFYEGGGGAQVQLGYSGPDNGNVALTNGGNQAQMDAAVIPAARLSGYQGRVRVTNDVTLPANASASINVARAHGVIFNGTLTMNAGATLAIGSGSLGTLAATDGAVYFNATTFTGAGTRTVNTIGDLSLGNVTGAGASTLIKQGVGNLILDAAALPGGTIVQIQAGQVIVIPDLVNNLNNLGAGNIVQVPAGVTTNPTLQVRTQTGQIPYDNPLQINSNATLEMNSSNVINVADVGILYTGSATLANNAVLNLRPQSSTNAFFANMAAINGTGTINVSGNALVRLTVANSFTSATPITMSGSAALEVLSTSNLGAASNPVNITGGSTLSLQGTGGGLTYANPITMAGGGTGTVGNVARVGALEAFDGGITLTGALSLSGSTTIGTRNNGSLTSNSNLALGANTITLNPTAGDIALGGVISGTGGVTKVGGGLGILTGNNTYSGATNVNAGTLEARGPSTGAIGTGASTVNSGGTLLVTGATALGNPSSITLNGGTFRVNSPAGTVSPTTPTVTANAGSVVDVAAGTLNMPAATLNLAAAVQRQGLVERFASGVAWPDVNNPIAFALSVGANNGVQNTVRMGNFNTVTQGTAPTNWQDNTIFVYTGQIQARTSTLTFSEHVDDNTLVRINVGAGFQNVISDTAWNVPQKSATLTGLTPGQYYDVEIRFFNGGGGAGPSAQAAGATLGWANNYGFGVSDTENSGAANGLGNVYNATTLPQFFRPGDTVAPTGGIADPLGADRFRTVSPTATLNIAAGAAATFGRVTGGGDFSIAAGAPGGALTLAAANTSTFATFGVTGASGSATLTTNAGHVASVSTLNIPTGTTLTKAGPGTLNVNGQGGAGTGTLAVTGGTLGGTGRVPGPTTMAANTRFSPGTSVGQLSFGGNVTMTGPSAYTFEYASIDQPSVSNPANYGITHDHLNGTGTSALNLTAVGAGQFTIDIQNGPAAAPGLINYTIATFAGGITGFAPTQFAFAGPGFIPGTASIALGGTNNLVLTFQPVPEPLHILALGGAAIGFGAWIRRRREVA